MNTPTAIILADQPLNKNMQTVFGRQETASLMIAGNPLIEHILMELQDMQIQQCFVLARGNAGDILASVGNTDRWGMDMRIEVMNYSLNKEQVLRQFKSLSEPNGLLVIEADRLRSHCVDEFVREAGQSEYSLLEANANGVSLGITFLKPTNADFIINAMPINLDSVMTNKLAGTRDFHRANFDLIAGKFSGLSPSVRLNENLNRFQHWASKVHKKSVTSNSVMIGEHCRVGKNVQLDAVILNHDVFLDKNTTLSNTIVMPNSVITGGMPIKDAIVNKNTVYALA